MKDNLQHVILICRVTFSHPFDTLILKIHLKSSKLQAVEVYMHHHHTTS